MPPYRSRPNNVFTTQSISRVSRDREGGRAAPRRAAPRYVPVAVIKHLVIDATRINLRYRDFTGNWLKKLLASLDLRKVSQPRDYTR